MIGFWQAVKTIFKKEMTDALRDRRAIFLLILYGVLPPLMMMVSAYLTPGGRQAGKPVEVAIVGAAHAPGLIAHLQSIDMQLKADAPVKLVIPPNYASKIQAGEKVTLTLTGSRRDDDRAMGKIEQSINGYNRTLGAQRLILRGVSPAILQPLDVQVRNTDEGSYFAIILSQSFIYFFIIAGASAAMGIAIDAAAGERERRSIEVLLSRPVPRGSIAVGKWLAVSSFATLGITVCSITFAIMIARGVLAKMGAGFSFSFADVPQVVLTLMPFAMMLAALQLLVAFLAKSFKEAQAYLGFTLMVPIALTLLFSFGPLQGAWARLVPLGYEIHIVKSILAGGGSMTWHWFLVAAVELLITAALLWLTTLRLNSGKLLAGH
jgi:sodium transport system permease protein